MLSNNNDVPVGVLIADSDCWKLQSLLEINADVDIFWMCEKVSQFTSNQVRE